MSDAPGPVETPNVDEITPNVDAEPEAHTTTTNPPAPRFRIRVFFQRFAVAHVFSLPIAFLWAVASMPLATHLFFDQIEPLAHDEQAAGQYVVRLVAWPAAIVAILLHIFAFTWGVIQSKKSSQWVFLGGFGALLGVGVLFGAISWLWLFLR